MFTGIVEGVGRIRRLVRAQEAEGARLEVALEGRDGERRIEPGSSIAVNGCCLTVAEATKEGFAADLSAETLRRTSFSELAPGAPVNLERPLRAGGELGGHFVLGHVDGVGRIERLEREGAGAWLVVRVPGELEGYIAEKGSLAIDGISLTVARRGSGQAEFALIPYTIEHTNLAEKRAGDSVNLECDVLARYLERLLAAREEPAGTQLTLKRLIEQGF